MCSDSAWMLAPLTRRVALTAALCSLDPRALVAAPPPPGYSPLRAVDASQNAFRLIEADFSTDFAPFLARLLINSEPITRRWWEQKQREAAAFAADVTVQRMQTAPL